MSEFSCRPVQNGFSKAFQVGLECGDLLFQGEETLLHLVKLQGQRCVTSADFASWALSLPLTCSMLD